MMFFRKQTIPGLILTLLMTTLLGCGLDEGIHVSRDEGLSTSRFRYEFEAIPDALVMREDTEPRWQLGRYVFVRGADRLLVVTRITSWSDTATKKQRERGDIPDMRDRMLERLWITIPQGTAVGDELDLHNLGYRFLVNYDQGNVGDEQFARPFRVLGNVRILEESDTHLTMRLRIRLTTAETTAWAVNEESLRVPLLPEGRHARRASPDAVIYAVSRVGEVPFVGQRPVPIAPDGTVDLPETPGALGSQGYSNPSIPSQTDEAATQPATTQPAQGAPDATSSTPAAAAGEPGELPGRWYLRSPQWEVYLQLNDDRTFIQMASRPQAAPMVLHGDWAMRSGYLVLQIKGQMNRMGAGGESQYAILEVDWINPHTFSLDGALPGPGASREGYRFRRAVYPDLKHVPALSYQPESPEPAYVGEEPAPAPAAVPETK